jgi:hypothetical protein
LRQIGTTGKSARRRTWRFSPVKEAGCFGERCRRINAPRVSVNSSGRIARVFGNSPDFWLNVRGELIYGKRCIHRASGNGSNARHL